MLIIPAALTKKSEETIEQIDAVRGVVPWIQIDIMDGTMTPEKNFDLRELVGHLDDFHVEVHLMTTHPEQYLEACEEIGASRVYFHLEEVESPGAVLAAMDGYSFTKGIALSPQTPATDVFTYIDEIDAVQVMTVVPGAQGGLFLEEMLEKIPYLRERRTEIWISVDGGVNAKTIDKVASKQLDAAGVGSAISKSDDPVEAIRDLAIAAETAATV